MSKTVISVFDTPTTKIAVLENAISISPQTSLTDIGALSFEIPFDDPKRKHLVPFHYIETARPKVDGSGELERTGMFRILPMSSEKNTSGGRIKVQCEHVLATLLDDVIPGWHQFGGYQLGTRGTLSDILSYQTTKHWKLGDCEYDDDNEYGVQHSKPFTAILLVLKSLLLPWFDCDVSKYPFTLNLRKIDVTREPTFRIAWGYNTTKIKREIDPSSLVNRLYCFGYGEGVNQLTIESVNGGVPYVEDTASIEKYGLKSDYLIERDIEDAVMLKKAGEVALSECSVPTIRYTTEAANLYDVTKNDIDRPRVGKTAYVYDDEFGEFVTYISSVKGDDDSITVTLSTTPTSAADAVASIAGIQRTEQTYAQGATQLYSWSIQANAAADNGAFFRFWIPDEMRVVNKVLARIALLPFRTFAAFTRSGGASSQSSDASTKETTDSGGAFNFALFTSKATPFNRVLNQTNFDNHYHTGDVTALNHRHHMEHTHTVRVPAHAHSVIPGIFEEGNPSSAGVYINGHLVANIGAEDELDLTTLLLDSSGKVPRGQWNTIEVRPDDLAYVSVDMFVQGFIQSRGGGVY